MSKYCVEQKRFRMAGGCGNKAVACIVMTMIRLALVVIAPIAEPPHAGPQDLKFGPFFEVARDIARADCCEQAFAHNPQDPEDAG